MSKKKTNRFMELEGLRGIAAVMVVVYHFLQAFYAVAIYGFGHPKAPVQHMRFEDNLYGVPFAGLFSGTFAVAIFFVLSGFVLSIAFFKTNKPDIIKKMALKRYPRLMLPALAAVLLSLLLIKVGYNFKAEAGATTQSWWLLTMGDVSGGVLLAIKEAAWNIFVDFDTSKYNPVLWTMSVEFIGSFIVFGFVLLFGNSQRRWLLYVVLLLVLAMINLWLAGFVIGMALADLYARGGVTYINRKKVTTVALLALAVFLGGYPYAVTDGTLYQYITVPYLDIDYRALYTVIGASIILYVVLTAKEVAGFLQKRWISELGKYTFSLYLVHVPVLLTLTAGVFALLFAHVGYHAAAVLALFVSLPVIVALTWVFERYVDAPSVRFAAYLTRLYYSPTPLAVRERMALFAMSVKMRLLPGKMPDMEEE